MTCKDCKAAQETTGLWSMFNTPKCRWCTARLIQRLGKLHGVTPEQITARRQVVLADAVAFGHSEAEIRKLAKGPMALEGRGK